MWERRSHKLAPLNNITSSKVKCKWTKVEQDTFDKINRIVARDTLLDYPYFNEEFKIHTDASKFQLGEVISNKGNQSISIVENLIIPIKVTQ